MTEDQIEPLCLKLFQAIKAQDTENSTAIALELLAGALVSLNRIAWFLGEIHFEQERIGNQ